MMTLSSDAKQLDKIFGNNNHHIWNQYEFFSDLAIESLLLESCSISCNSKRVGLV